MPHGRHIYAKACDMEKATMRTYPQCSHALTHWKCILWFCADCTCINITDQETDKQNSDTKPSIRFHIYHRIGRCTAHGRITLKEKKICCTCSLCIIICFGINMMSMWNDYIFTCFIYVMCFFTRPYVEHFVSYL